MIRYVFIPLILAASPAIGDVTIKITGTLQRPTCATSTTEVQMPPLIMGSTPKVYKDFTFIPDQNCVMAGARLAFYAESPPSPDGNKYTLQAVSTHKNITTSLKSGENYMEFCAPGTPASSCKTYSWDLTRPISLTAVAALWGSDAQPGSYVSTISAAVVYP